MVLRTSDHLGSVKVEATSSAEGADGKPAAEEKPVTGTIERAGALIGWAAPFEPA